MDPDPDLVTPRRHRQPRQQPDARAADALVRLRQQVHLERLPIGPLHLRALVGRDDRDFEGLDKPAVALAELQRRAVHLERDQRPRQRARCLEAPRRRGTAGRQPGPACSAPPGAPARSPTSPRPPAPASRLRVRWHVPAPRAHLQARALTLTSIFRNSPPPARVAVVAEQVVAAVVEDHAAKAAEDVAALTMARPPVSSASAIRLSCESNSSRRAPRKLPYRAAGSRTAR